MRRILIASATFISAFGAQTANAQDIELSGKAEIATSSINDDFNELISDEPLGKVTVLAEFGDMYVEAYFNGGLDRPLDGDGTEAGILFGTEREVGGITARAAIGRYDNYAGQGIGEGDWIVSLGAEHQGFSIDAIAFIGASDTVAVRTAYEAQITDRVTLTASAVWLTAYGAINPGFAAEYALNDRVSARFSVIYPETTDGQKLFAAFSVAFGF
jgi:hypothetical protein